jgi:hypothetical protein
MHCVGATDSYPSPARRGATAHATTGHAGGDGAATSHRGTSIRQFEIPHLRTSTIPAAWTARSTNGNQSGRSRLESEVHDEYSRRTQATCSPAGHLILLPPVITQRQRAFVFPKQKSDAPALGTSLEIALSLSFRNSLKGAPFYNAFLGTYPGISRRGINRSPRFGLAASGGSVFQLLVDFSASRE